MPSKPSGSGGNGIMTRDSLELEINLQELAAQLHACITRLFPICRSITGDGVRETLSILSETVPLDIHTVPSGTQVLDWTIPNEWNIHDAWVKDASGQRVIDFQQSNLHVLNYSTPIK
ncbi:MAG: aminopeptidase-like protein [Halioglobus sp.]